LSDQLAEKDLKIYIAQGACILSINKDTLRKSTGDWFEIKSGSTYSLVFLDDTTLVELRFDPIV